ncbi:reverse transcriptase domain-containing protein [Tanacetum coccineum]
MSQLKKLKPDELKEEFDKCVEKVEKFILMNSELEASKLKRTGIDLQAKVFKKQKITDVTKDESVKREEKFKVQQPILRYNVRKSLARKGLQKNKSEYARSDTKEDVEAYMDEPSSEEFQIGSIPQGSTPAKIVNWQILKTGKKGAYQIIREDHTYIVYMNFQGLLNDLTRDDLKELYRLMILKYGDSRPEEEYERVLWRDLNTMFEPPSIGDIFIVEAHNEDTQRNLKFTSEDQVRGGLLGIIVNRLKSGSYRVKSGRHIDLDLFKLAIVLQKAKQIQDFGPTSGIRASRGTLMMMKHHSMKMHQTMVLHPINQNNNNNNSFLQQPRGVAYQGPTIPITSSPKVVERRTEVTKDTIFPTNNGITEDVQPPVVPVENQNPVSEPVDAPVSAPMPNPKPSIPYPSRRNDEKHRENANEQKEKFYEIFKDMSFEISFVDALTLMPKFASTLKALIGNKEKLSEMARTPLNEHCSAVILNKLPEKLGDPGRFLIPCKFPGMDECLALADLGASINLMPFSVWKKLNLPNLTPTCMTLELADRSISRPIGIAKDVNVKVGVFQFPADFVVVDFEPDPRVPLILERCFLKTSRALIDVYEGELTLRVDNEAITYNLDQTSRYSVNYNDMTANRIDIVELTCEEYSQEVLGFSNVIASGNPTPGYDSIVSNSSPTLTPFGDSDFLLLEEADAFLSLADDPTSPKVDESYYDPKGDILILEDLPPHLEYAFLEDNNKLPVIIAKDLSVDEKTALIKVLKSRKRAIAWKLSDIKGINPEFYSHKILREDDYEPTVQHQRRVNPKIHDVIKKEVEKLLDAGLIYPISDSPWLNEATRKDHFPLPFMDQMLERLAGNEYYCFLDGFSGYFQIPIDLKDQEKTTFTCPYGTFAYRRMPFGLCNAPGTFQRCMMAIFHDMIEKTMEVFMDDFSVFGNSFSTCLSNLEKMLKRCEDTNLALNWEKRPFYGERRHRTWTQNFKESNRSR